VGIGPLDVVDLATIQCGVGRCEIDKLLWTEYHRLAVPDKYWRVLPVCSKEVDMLNLITKTLWSFWK
jgi:hypothetical protein